MILCKELFFIGALYEGQSVGGTLYNGEAIFLGHLKEENLRVAISTRAIGRRIFLFLKYQNVKKIRMPTFRWSVFIYSLSFTL